MKTKAKLSDFGRVAFGVRCGVSPAPMFLKAWTHFLADRSPVRKGDAMLSPSIELPHHWSAEALAHRFLTHTKCDTLLMIDDDMVFEPKDAIKLRDHRENWKYGIVQGLCCSSKTGHRPLVLGEVPGSPLYRPLLPKPTDRTIPVGMTGLAFTLIRRSTFEAIAATKDPIHMFFRWGPEGKGEDGLFCENARNAGVKIGVDSRVNIGHCVSVIVNWNVKKRRPQYQKHVDQAFKELLRGRKKLKLKKADKR